MAPDSSESEPLARTTASPFSTRLAFDSLLEPAVYHEVVFSPSGEAQDYRILDCNAAFTRATGIKREQAIGRLASQVYGVAPPYLEIFARVAETGEPARFDAFATSMDRYFSISAVSPRRGHFVTIATDVTDRERTIEALRRYQLLADQGLDIVLFVRKDDGRILEANTAAVQAYGYSRDQLCARTIDDLRDPARGMTDSQIAAADAAGILFESVHRRKDGSEFPVEVSSRGANLCGVRVLMSLIRDISERKLAMEALASERARLSATLHSIGDGVIATDDEARVTLLNEVAERLTGWSAAEASGRPVDEVFRIVDEDGRHAAKNPVERVLREGSTVALAPHTRLIARDGSERPIADRGAPIRDEEGTVSGAVLVFRDETVERQSELALERSEARYRDLFENLPEAVTIFDAVRDRNGQIVDWIVRKQNKQALVALGPAVGSLEGSRLTEILGPEDALQHIELSREVMRTGIPSTREIYLKLTKRHYRACVFALDEKTLVSSSFDITQGKEAERALGDSERLYRSLFTLAPSGVMLTDEGGKVLAFNDRAAAQLGYSRHEFGRLSIEDLDALRSPDEVRKRIASVFSEGEARFPACLRTKAGTLRSMLVSATAVAIEGKRRLLSVLQDETERLEATEALRESEELFRAAFKTSPDSINLNRLRDGTYVAVNQGFTRILGWTEAEVIGHSSLSLQIWKDPADRAHLVEQLTAKGFVENFEADFRAKDGRVIPGLMSARVLRVRGEQLLLNITRDITSWKRAEAERTSLQNRLQEAAKLEAIGQLAGGVAHDFNNLLTVILSCAEAALADLEEGNPPSAAELEEISAAGLRARDLIRQLLAVARRQVISPVAMDLNAVVSGSERLLRRLVGEDIELAMTCQKDLWPVLCDPGQLEQIIMNLAVNARDAMPDGGRISIETSNLTEEEPDSVGKPKAAPRELVRLLVRDTGTGMSAAVKERIFEPFFTTKGPGRGSGLGLATVYGIVKQSGGSIRVDTVEGRGTVFDVRFPRTRQPIDQGPGSPSPSRRSGTERVLLVEDDDGVREVTTRALRDGGYDVRMAESAARAIEMAKAGARFDLLVTDVVMPQIDGRNVAAALRERIPGLRVLFISGHAERLLTHGGILEPGIDFLSKPFTPSSLLVKVREMLDAQPST